jgi:hypothetical protein
VSKLIPALVGLAFTIAIIAGWIINLVGTIKLGLAGVFTTMFVLKVIGIFVAPLGAILGLFF